MLIFLNNFLKNWNDLISQILSNKFEGKHKTSLKSGLAEAYLAMSKENADDFSIDWDTTIDDGIDACKIFSELK